MTQIDKSRFEWIGSDSARREGISRPSTTFWKDAIGRLMKNKVAVVCFFIIVLLILSCIIVPFFSPFESREQHLGEVNKGFMTVCTDSRYEGQHHVHYFGTDNLGRDLFLRAFEGGRVSLMEITDEGYAILQFGGGCNGCSMVDVTLKEGIEKQLLAEFPELKGVRDLTEHQRGEHSYY